MNLAKTPPNRAVHFVLLAALSLVASCGGGSSSSPTTPGNPPMQPPVSNVVAGKLSGFVVEGLLYSTPTQSGMTDATGTFNYVAGEQVEFLLGDQVVGSPVSAKATIEFVELFPNTYLPTNLTEARNVLFADNNSLIFKDFTKLRNWLSVILTIDRNPSDGIQIPAAIHQHFVNRNINFESSVVSLTQTGLKIAVADAVSTGLLSSHAIKSTGQALDQFYTVLGITPDFSINTATSTERLRFGETDPVITPAVPSEKEYFDSGKIKYTFSGTASDFTERTYSYNDNLDSTQVVEYSESATPAALTNISGYIRTWEYSSTDQLLSERYDPGFSGISSLPDGSLYINEYGTRGLLVKRTTPVASLNQVSKTVEYELNQDGYVQSFTTTASSVPPTVSVTNLSLDQKNRVIETALDVGNDGTTEQTTTNAYDSNGNKILEATLSMSPGFENQRLVWTYNEQNSETLSEVYLGSNEQLVISERTEYDERNIPINFSSLNIETGELETFTRFTFNERDQREKFIIYITDEMPEGFVQRECTYDDAGNLLNRSFFSYSSTGTSTPSVSETYEYSNTGALTTYTEETLCEQSAGCHSETVVRETIQYDNIPANWVMLIDDLNASIFASERIVGLCWGGRRF